MQIDLMFYELTAEEAHRLTQCAAEMPEPSEEIAPPEPKRKRRTKAEMAEAGAAGQKMEDRAAEEAEDPRSQGEDDPPIGDEYLKGIQDRASEPRRRKRGDDENPTDGASTAGGSSRKKTRRPAVAGTAKSPSPDDPSPKRQRRRKKADDDEISDADVAKAASEGAKQHTPKVVTGILEEFGVDNVAELSQKQRREFMKALDDYEAF